MTLYIGSNGREVVINDAVHAHMHHALSIAHGHRLLVLLFLTRIRCLVLLLTHSLLAHSVLSRAICLSLATVVVVIVAASVRAVVLNNLEALLAITITRLNLRRMLIRLLHLLLLFRGHSLHLTLLQNVV